MLTTQNHIILQQRAIRADKKQKITASADSPRCSVVQGSGVESVGSAHLAQLPTFQFVLDRAIWMSFR